MSEPTKESCASTSTPSTAHRPTPARKSSRPSTSNTPPPFASQASGKVHGPTVVAETVNWLHAQFPRLQLTILAIVAGNDIVAYSAIPIAPSDVPGEASGDARNTVDLLERTPAPIIE